MARRLSEEEKKKREELKKKKEEEKNIELQKLLEKYPFELVKFKEDDEKFYYEFVLGFNIKPYERTRKGLYGQMYDPLGKYKNEIKKVIKHHLKLPLKIKKEVLNVGRCEINLITNVKLPKNATKKQQLYALKNIYRPLQKPDMDNIEKTLFDIMTGIFYYDDTQIVKVNHEKFFRLQESTLLNFTVYKEDIKIEGRITKQEEEELCQLIQQMKIY